MVSVMEIKSEVFGGCVEGIDVSVDVKYQGRCLCFKWKYLRFIWARKVAQDRQWRWVMVPGIGYCFVASGDV